MADILQKALAWLQIIIVLIKIYLTFVHKGLIDNKPALAQIYIYDTI